MAQQLRADVTVEDRMIELVPKTAKAAIMNRPGIPGGCLI
jgi:hypothetical protein